MEAILTWSAVTAILAALCLAKPEAGRIALAALFAAMALLVNVTFAIGDPQRFVDFADGAYLPFYREASLRVVTLSPPLFGFAVALYELTIAALALGRGGAARIGLAGMFLFLIGIVPLGKEEGPNLILAAGVAYLLTRRFHATVLVLARGWLRRGHASLRPTADRRAS